MRDSRPSSTKRTRPAARSSRSASSSRPSSSTCKDHQMRITAKHHTHSALFAVHASLTRTTVRRRPLLCLLVWRTGIQVRQHNPGTEGQRCRLDFDAMVCSLTPPMHAPSICALAFDCVPRALSNGRSLPTSTSRPTRRKCANYKIHVLSALTAQNHEMNHGTTARPPDRPTTDRSSHEPSTNQSRPLANDSPIIDR